MKLRKHLPACLTILALIVLIGALKIEFVKDDRPLAFVKRFKPNVDIENRKAL